jgi:hypothetical protein
LPDGFKKIFIDENPDLPGCQMVKQVLKNGYVFLFNVSAIESDIHADG